jgi:hypothetical protein
MKNFLKEKIKNKFILIIVSIIIIAVWTQWYLANDLADINTKSYVVLVKWEVKINDEILNKENRKELLVWDKIITKVSSICVIEWWDWSLTRLWENWKIEIQELNVEKDLSKINLQFKLTKWKTWSNVVSFLWKESYFKQNFEDIAASVRWTIFDVNLEKDYIYVENHEVKVKKWDKEEIISKNNAFSISTFSFIEIEKFVKNIQDKVWSDVNKNLDLWFIKDLKKDVLKEIDLESIDKLLEENTTYKELLSEYQKLNFVWADDSELFKAKNKIRKLLINKASEEDKQNLVRYTVFDLKDAIEWKKIDSIKDNLSVILENKDILKDLDINIWEDILKDFDNFWNDMKSIISDFDIPELNINLDSIKNKAKDYKNDADNKIKELKNNFNLDF